MCFPTHNPNTISLTVQANHGVNSETLAEAELPPTTQPASPIFIVFSIKCQAHRLLHRLPGSGSDATTNFLSTVGVSVGISVNIVVRGSLSSNQLRLQSAVPSPAASFLQAPASSSPVTHSEKMYDLKQELEDQEKLELSNYF
ncbi:uncharacterized protein LOC110265308 [Arachis ipaensis]|uniref:uncharacterized protein LOC110265308 n=1 Tax=Arachis ipaensis TaxID=130454 RepID=UPI000A2B5F5D|nr:uncharacterized protein LOC110265308 [Arachis ipaensis]